MTAAELDPKLGRARVAIFGYFFVLGAATATWSARLPAIKGLARDLPVLMATLAVYGAVAGLLLDVSMNACGAAGVMSPHDDRGRPAQKRRSESSSVPRIRS